jgi:hypothetical protein
VGGRAAGAHEPDGVLGEFDVHDEQDPVLLGHADEHRPLCVDLVLDGQGQRVGEDRRGLLEGDPVLPLVGGCLAGVPGEVHGR